MTTGSRFADIFAMVTFGTLAVIQLFFIIMLVNIALADMLRRPITWVRRRAARIWDIITRKDYL